MELCCHREALANTTSTHWHKSPVRGQNIQSSVVALIQRKCVVINTLDMQLSVVLMEVQILVSSELITIVHLKHNEVLIDKVIDTSKLLRFILLLPWDNCSLCIIDARRNKKRRYQI